MLGNTQTLLLVVAIVLEVLFTPNVAEYNLMLCPNRSANATFNFNSKKLYLREMAKLLVDCIKNSKFVPGGDDNTTDCDPSRKFIYANQTLMFSTEGSPDGERRAVFKFTGSRNLNESCLADSPRKDFIRRLYDARCLTYDQKINLLNHISCNATQNLECRQVGSEEHRYAEQDTPIMQCGCPDYNKHQAMLNSSIGYYDPTRRICVLKVGEICSINPKGHDKRLIWRDIDFQETGIDLVELRPMAETYPCVKHSFCYTNDSKGLPLTELSRNRCVCESGYFPGEDGECYKGHGETGLRGSLIALFMFIIGLTGFLAGILVY